MKFGRKSKAPQGRGAGGSNRKMQRQAQPQKRAVADRELAQNTGSDGFPGSAGYPNGPKTALPTFFLTRRPDGKPDKVIKKKRWFG